MGGREKREKENPTPPQKKTHTHKRKNNNTALGLLVLELAGFCFHAVVSDPRCVSPGPLMQAHVSHGLRLVLGIWPKPYRADP